MWPSIEKQNARSMDTDRPTCGICRKEIEEGSPAIATRKGEINNYGDGPLFSVTGHRGIFHKRCFEQIVAPHVRPDGDEDIDTWIDRHIPVSERVVTAALKFDTPGEMARSVQKGSIMRRANVGEKTAAEMARLLLKDDLLREPPGYLPSSFFDESPNQ